MSTTIQTIYEGGFMRTPAFFLTVILLIICNATVQARIIHVPADSTTIQGGINGASAGDTVMVHPGTYYEHDIDFLGKAITVMGTDPEDSATVASTVVDGDSLGMIFVFQSDEDSTSRLEGLTVTNAAPPAAIYCCNTSSPYITNNFVSGGLSAIGIQCVNTSSPIISNNVITYSNYAGFGGIQTWDTAAPRIINNVIKDNGTSAIYIRRGRVIVEGNLITGNRDGIVCIEGSSPLIKNNYIVENSWSGIDIAYYSSSAEISNNIISGNGYNGIHIDRATNIIITNNIVTRNGNEGIGVGSYSSAYVKNTIIWNNSVIDTTGGEIRIGVYTQPSNFVISYSCVEGGSSSVYVESGSTLNWGDGMIDTDPLFVNPDSSDYHLQSTSPCIDAGDPSYDVPRGCGCTIDMGAYEYWQGISCVKREPAGSIIVP
jgi:parallel beta-helix repeat protein